MILDEMGQRIVLQRFKMFVFFFVVNLCSHVYVIWLGIDSFFLQASNQRSTFLDAPFNWVVVLRGSTLPNFPDALVSFLAWGPHRWLVTHEFLKDLLKFVLVGGQIFVCVLFDNGIFLAADNLFQQSVHGNK